MHNVPREKRDEETLLQAFSRGAKNTIPGSTQKGGSLKIHQEGIQALWPVRNKRRLGTGHVQQDESDVGGNVLEVEWRDPNRRIAYVREKHDRKTGAVGSACREGSAPRGGLAEERKTPFVREGTCP